MSFRLKTFLMIIFEIGALITSATSCGGAQLALCDTIGLVSGYVIGHLAELHLRQAHVERRKSEARVLEEKRLLEKANADVVPAWLESSWVLGMCFGRSSGCFRAAFWEVV